MKTSTKILLGVGVPLVSLSPLVSLVSCSSDTPKYREINVKNDGLYFGIKNIEWKAVNQYNKEYPFTLLGDLWCRVETIFRKDDGVSPDLIGMRLFTLGDNVLSSDQIEDIHLEIKGILMDSPVSNITNLNLGAITSPTTESIVNLKNRLANNIIKELKIDEHNVYPDFYFYEKNNFDLVYNNKKIDTTKENIDFVGLSSPNYYDNIQNVQIDAININPITDLTPEIIQSQYGFKNKFPIEWSQYSELCKYPIDSLGRPEDSPNGLSFYNNVEYDMKKYYKHKINIKSINTGNHNQQILEYVSNDFTAKYDLYENCFNSFGISNGTTITNPFIKKYKNKTTLEHRKEIGLSYCTKAELDTAIANNDINLNTLFRMSDEIIPAVENLTNVKLTEEQIIKYAPYISVSNEIRNLILTDPNYKIKLSDTLDYSDPRLSNKIEIYPYKEGLISSAQGFNYWQVKHPTDKTTNNIQ